MNRQKTFVKCVSICLWQVFFFVDEVCFRRRPNICPLSPIILLLSKAPVNQFPSNTFPVKFEHFYRRIIAKTNEQNSRKCIQDDPHSVYHPVSNEFGGSEERYESALKSGVPSFPHHQHVVKETPFTSLVSPQYKVTL